MDPADSHIAPEKHFEQLTTTGPYSGTLEAFTTGVKLRTRYQHLWEKVVDNRTLFWASECDRVIDTARYFGAGFFGLESERAELRIISEDESKAGDTLTPGYAFLTLSIVGYGYFSGRVVV